MKINEDMILAFTGTIYDYNRAGIIAFKLPDLPPSRMEELKAWLKQVADERRPLRITIEDS